MSIENMYRPKKANVEKLDKYIEKLKKDGKLYDDSPIRERDTGK